MFCVIDRSDSMSKCLNDTIQGFNTFISRQPPDTPVTTFLFNNTVNELYRCQKASEVKPLNNVTYRPAGCTALLDAIGRAIEVASNCTADTITMVVLTDGEENASSRYTKHQINKLIDDRKAQGWKFVFMGANQDAIQVADDLGIDQEGALTFDTTCVRDAFRCLSDAVTRLQTGKTPRIEFSQLERQSSVIVNGPP